jgi:tetratricopeptide (TPR) repeat protein
MESIFDDDSPDSSDDPDSAPLRPEVEALMEDYRRASNHITEFAKLQYQLVGLAYTVAGTAIALGVNSSSQLQSTLLLLFPPVFCGIVWVQLYLHTNIKSIGIYTYFQLRPRMEAIINPDPSPFSKYTSVWEWEDYYENADRYVRLVVRGFGFLINVLPLLPAIGALYIYGGQSKPSEPAFFYLDVALVLITFILFAFVMFVNNRARIIEEDRFYQEPGHILRRALLLYNSKNSSKAMQLLKKALTLDPISADTYCVLGMISGPKEEKLNAFKHALAINPKHKQTQEELRKLRHKRVSISS